MPKKDFLFLHLSGLPYFRAFLRAVESAYYQDIDLPSPTLDVGCGDGNFAALTFDHNIDVGLDPWHGPIHEAKPYGKYTVLVEADGGTMPFSDGYFSSAFSNSVLEHIPHVDLVIKETSRVLKSGAPFVFCVPITIFCQPCPSGEDWIRSDCVHLGICTARFSIKYPVIIIVTIHWSGRRGLKPMISRLYGGGTTFHRRHCQLWNGVTTSACPV